MKCEQIKLFDCLYEDYHIRKGEPNGQKVAVSWSGGKDSTATAILSIIDGYEVKMATSLVMFTPDIPLISKRQVDFIECTADKFREYGATVDIIKPISYYELCMHTLNKSPYPERNGKLRGYPCPVHCEFQKFFKSKPLSEWSKNNGCDITFIGICYDEIARQGQLNDRKRSLLCEKQITQKGAMEICRMNDMLSPVYETGSRDGCALCFNERNPSRTNEWLDDYPQARPILKELDETLKREAIFGNRWGRGGITLEEFGVKL